MSLRGPHHCPVELALDLLGGKWRVVLLAHVKEEARRYSELRRLVPRMSEKMLTQRLRELTASGLIERRGGAYALTPRGESARRVLDALYVWGQRVAEETGARIEPLAGSGRVKTDARAPARAARNVRPRSR